MHAPRSASISMYFVPKLLAIFQFLFLYIYIYIYICLVERPLLFSAHRSGIALIVSDVWNDLETGEDEGFYAWVAANYALGSLGGEPQETTGIVELGGASLQVIIH